MKTITVALFLVAVLFTGGVKTALAQGPTETPTATPTETSTPTETPTITPTPDLYSLTTLEPGGQAGGIIYLVTAGQAAIFSELSFISIILVLFVFVALRRRG